MASITAHRDEDEIRVSVNSPEYFSSPTYEIESHSIISQVLPIV